MDGVDKDSSFNCNEFVYRVEWVENIPSMTEYQVLQWDGVSLRIVHGQRIRTVQGHAELAQFAHDKKAAAISALQILAIESTTHCRSYPDVMERSNQLGNLFRAIDDAFTDASDST